MERLGVGIVDLDMCKMGRGMERGKKREETNFECICVKEKGRKNVCACLNQNTQSPI